MIMTFSEYANSVGKSKVYIHKLYKQGRLKKALVEHPESGKIMVNKKIADKILTGSKFNDEVFDQNCNNDDEFLSMTYDEARRMKIYYEGKMERLKHEKEIEKLVSSEDVKNDAYKASLILRDTLLAIPGQIAPVLSTMTSIFDIKKTLTDCIKSALDNMCKANLNKLEEIEE